MHSTATTNAWLDPDLTLRVGVPHFSGTLPAHCSEEDIPVMVSAGAFWRPAKGSFAEPGEFGWTTDACNVALDSAGFVAMRQWSQRGRQSGMGGVYAWSLEQYLQLVCDVWPRWYSAPDACVEPEIAPDAAAVRERCDLTIELLEQCLLMAWHYSSRMDAQFRPPVPVLQGWRESDYRTSLQRTLEVWDTCTDGTRFERSPTLIGIGSVCRRQLHHPEHGLYRILDAVAKDLPAGTKLHLFGVKGAAVETIRAHYPMVASVDSMAWDFGARVAARKQGVSNSMAHRLGHLERWHSAHEARIRAAARQTPLFDSALPG